MDMQFFYEQMKDALKFFGLRFSEMNEVEVSVKGKNIVFTHGSSGITFEL